jgi:hypothetical protein
VQTRLAATALSTVDALHCRIDCAEVRCGGLPPYSDTASCPGIDGSYSVVPTNTCNASVHGNEETRAQYSEENAARHEMKIGTPTASAFAAVLGLSL